MSLTLDGKTATITGVSGSTLGIKSIQTFSSAGTYTWTKPSGITKIRVYVTGGGAGGGSHNTDDAQGGGGAGGTAIKDIDVTNVSSVTVTVGAGSAGSAGNTSAGGTWGGISSFGSYCSAMGGRPVVTWGIGGFGGWGIGGDINIRGGNAHTGNIDGYANSERGGTGGASYWGSGGRGGTNWMTRQNGRAPGSGGGGTQVNSSNQGGSGAPGIVVVEEY